MRGEHMVVGVERAGGSGSSPHARGTQGEIAKGDLAFRLIPACAGNTMVCAGSSSSNAAHPRMRGNTERHSGVPGAGGAHPRMRGEHFSRRNFK